MKQRRQEILTIVQKCPIFRPDPKIPYATDAGNLGNQVLTVPLDGSIMAVIEAWLIASAESPFAGGSATAGPGDSLDALRARKAAEMSQACTDAIFAGFPCDTLGVGYRYPSKTNDQANLTGSVVRSMYSTNAPDWRTPFWCADADGVWEFRPHTATEIQHVGDCAVVARLKCMGINEQLQAQIIAATTADEIAAITWPE